MAYDRYARGGDNPFRLDIDTLDMPKAQPTARPGAKRVAAPAPAPRAKPKPRIDPTTPNKPTGSIASPPPVDPDRFARDPEDISTEPPGPMGPTPPFITTADPLPRAPGSSPFVPPTAPTVSSTGGPSPVFRGLPSGEGAATPAGPGPGATPSLPPTGGQLPMMNPSLLSLLSRIFGGDVRGPARYPD